MKSLIKLINYIFYIFILILFFKNVESKNKKSGGGYFSNSTNVVSPNELINKHNGEKLSKNNYIFLRNNISEYIDNEKNNEKSIVTTKNDKKSKFDNNNLNNESINNLIKKFPEFSNITSQHLYMLSPSDQCKCHQRTIFFKYPSFIEQNIQNLNITDLIIKNKEYFVGAVQHYKNNIKYKKTFQSLNKTLSNNNLIRIYNVNFANLYFRYIGNNVVIPKFVNRYKKFNVMLKSYELDRKDLLYNNYKLMQNEYPEDFNYMPETYTSENKDIFIEKYKYNKISKDNLWLIKPKNNSGGRKISFLKNINDIKINDIITKYISEPLLINKRKFDFRIYLLVTGHDPLKIYIYQEGLIRLSAEEYDLDLNDLNNLKKHLTNTAINKNNKNGYKNNDILMSLSKVKNYLQENYNMDFNIIWEQIKDFSIKSFISINHLEINEEKKYKIHSNNLFEFYGIDVMIDKNFKPWLIEINPTPDIDILKSVIHDRNLKYKLMHDMFNIIGMVPYSHIDNHALEGECEYNNSTEEAVQQSICEFTRPLGGFEQIFPLKENIEFYKKFFKEISENNKSLWNKIKKP